MESPAQNSVAKKWEIATTFVDRLQDFIADENVTTEQLITVLQKEFPRDFPVHGTRLSVIYRPYIAPNKYKLIVLRNNLIEEAVLLPAQPFNKIATETILNVVKTGKAIREATSDSCEKKGFNECGSLLVVPMKVDAKRITGAFILEKTEANAFDGNDELILDRVSDRFAAFIRFVDYNIRSTITHGFLADLSANATKYQHEAEIFQVVVKHLLEANEAQQIEPWFSKKELDIILKHPFCKDSFYHVCREGEIIKDFRRDSVVQKADLSNLLGSNISFWFTCKEKTILNNEKDVVGHYLPGCYQSVAVIPMLIRDSIVGLFVLRNSQLNDAYKDEASLLEQVAEFTAISLRDFRNQRMSRQRRNFRNKFIRGQQPVEDKILYEACQRIIVDNFGEVELVVLAIDRENRRIKKEYPNDRVDFNSTDKLEKEIQKYIKKTDRNTNEEKDLDNKGDLLGFGTENAAYENTSLISDGHGQYAVFPIRAESRRITNVVLIRVNKPLGASTAAALNELFAIISFKQSFDRKKRRLEAMTAFGDAINKTNFLPDNYLVQMYKLIDEYINPYILMQNMYIALLDDDKMNIAFPLSFQKDSDGKLEEFGIKSRSFDRKVRSIPRTEYILIHKQPILIRTRKESEQWYKDHGDSEQVGDPFASWLGVPILEKGEAVGVIAVYHLSADYLYTDGERLFLQNIANSFSSLLKEMRLVVAKRKLEETIANNTELKELNRKLEEAVTIINDNEKSRQYLLQDIKFRTSRNLGLAKRQVAQAINDIDQTSNTGNIKTLKFTSEGLKTAESAIRKISAYADMMAAKDQSDFSLAELAETIIKQINQYKKITIYPNINGNAIVRSQYWILFDCFYSIFDDLLVKLSQCDKPVIFIEINQSKDDVWFELRHDANYPVFSSVDLSEVSEENFPYWKVNNALISINGELFISSGKGGGVIKIKLMRKVSLAKESEKVIIYDPEMGNVFLKWLDTEKYDVTNISSIADLEGFYDSPSLLVINMNSIVKGDKQNMLSECLRKFKELKLMLVFDDLPGKYVEFGVYKPGILFKYNSELDVISRAEFVSAIEKQLKEAG